MGKKIKYYYAVKRGFKPGIYKSWAECNAQINKFKNNLYQGFSSLSEAEQFLKSTDKNEKSLINKNNPTYAYIKGSFNNITKYYGYGGIIIHNNQKYIIKGNGNEQNFSKMNNIGGEIIACKETIKKAIELGIKDIVIFSSYTEIEYWASGKHKTNKVEIKNFHEFIKSLKDKININFEHPKKNSGIKENEEVYRIAKKACGNKKIKDVLFSENKDVNKEIEKEKEIGNKNIISLAEIKHSKKNEIRKNGICVIENINDIPHKDLLLKQKMLHEHLKKFLEKEIEKDKENDDK